MSNNILAQNLQVGKEMEMARVMLRAASVRTRNVVMRAYAAGFYRKPLPAMSIVELGTGRGVGLATVDEILQAREVLNRREQELCE